MNISEKDYKRYKKLAIIISGGDDYYADEILSEVLFKFIRNKITILNDNYIYTALNNMYIELVYRKEKKSRENLIIFYPGREENSTSIENIEDSNIKYDINIDIDNEYKKQAINNICLKLDIFHKTLYIEHLVKGLSQREISRRTGISLSVIHNRIKIVKSKIKKEYDRLKDGKK